MPIRVIITDHLHPYLAEQLIALGFYVDVEPDISNEQLATVIDQYEGLVLSTKILVTPRLIDAATRLRFIARAGSGMENIDSAYARQKGIAVISSPEGNANAVAEHAMGLLLGLTNNIVRADRDIRNGIWQREENRGIELEGKTIGIIGMGHTGTAFSKKLRGFDVTVIAYDKYKTGFSGEFVSAVRLEELQERADVISFHVPHSSDTHHYLNAGFIERCAKKFWLLNTSRGKIVDTDALISGLAFGKILGAGLDVFENEQFYQLPDVDRKRMDALCGYKNVILTPHVAGWTKESYFKISAILAERIALLDLQNVK